MRFRLEASPEELEQKGNALIKALAHQVRLAAPDLAERLEKALPPPEQTLKYPALQQLADHTREEYARTIERMVDAIGKVLDRSTKPDARYIEKSEGFEKAAAAAGPFIGPKGGKWSDPAHTVAWHPRVIQGEKPAVPEAPKVDTKKLLEGNHGIPRIEMPQIRSDLVPDFIQSLRDKNIGVKRTVQTVSHLKATQSELHVKGVQALIDDPEVRPKLSKPVITSRDGFILDGHHRWAALTTLDPEAKIETVEVDVPIGQLLEEAKGFHGVTFKKSDEPDEEFYDYTKPIADRDARAYQRVKAVLKHKGYNDPDFDEGGVLYGRSVNDLIEMAQSRDLSKAGPYIGPMGGKWADPQHKHHWDPTRSTGLHHTIGQLGGKIRPHETDPDKIVLKVPHQHAAVLDQIREQHGIQEPTKTGEKYTLLSVPKDFTLKELPKPTAKQPPKNKPKQSKAPGTAALPPYAKSEWKPHESVEEARSWAKAQGIDGKSVV